MTFFGFAVTTEVLQIVQPTVIVIAVVGWSIRVERALSRVETQLHILIENNRRNDG